ncbi:arylformamidase [Phyllobacterium ifriqiyense]|uniref:Arylformamidase n=1 Tax=Phyllobacterium ifriqiyense TaxID=314238 RepID=A0ABU0S419_9HYPH|nr:alpha/beta hydrolase [Phyllobacterium ifriqiyense]MDQ0995505.1 arylformamidase [Phyllobacterium ifriqiyense]
MENDPFRIRAHVADFDIIVEDIIAASARTRDRLNAKLDVPYGTGTNETLDIFLPDGARERRPVHIFIHGGYWRMFSKRDYSYIAETVTSAGAIAIIIDYALMPGSRMAVLVDQVRRAKQWVIQHIADYGGDPSRITVSGHSAGGHLATFLFHKPDGTSNIAAGLLLGGIYDLKPLQKSFLASEIGITDAEVEAFSPISHHYDKGCEVLIAVGANETPPFHQQAADFATLLAAGGQKVTTRNIAQADHMSSVRDLGREDRPSATLLKDLILRHR